MISSRFAVAVCILVAGQVWGTAHSWAAQPETEELARRDSWVAEHFPTSPAPTPVAPAAAQSDSAKLMVWTSYDRIFCNTLPTLPLQVAEQKFDHGLFCHAPSRVQVLLPGPAQSFSAKIGILTNPNSQGGSVICCVRRDEQEVYTSPVLHRGQPAVDVRVDLGGARDFYLITSCAGDGISSDQCVWGEATVTLADGQSVRLGDLPVVDPWTRERAADTPPFSFAYGGRHSDELLSQWQFQESSDRSVPGRTTRVRTYTDPQTGLSVRAPSSSTLTSRPWNGRCRSRTQATRIRQSWTASCRWTRGCCEAQTASSCCIMPSAVPASPTITSH